MTQADRVVGVKGNGGEVELGDPEWVKDGILRASWSCRVNQFNLYCSI
jgi:hypothetical protein